MPSHEFKLNAPGLERPASVRSDLLGCPRRHRQIGIHAAFGAIVL